MTKLAYRDTRDYVAIDVDKGIDHRTGKMVHADELAPENYEPMPKCKFCKHYQAQTSNSNMGECCASQPKFMAYADMAAVTCEDFTTVH